jgi:hypothetical protein
MQGDKSTPLSRRQLVKLGAAAGTVALGAVGLPTVAAAVAPPNFRTAAPSGTSIKRSRPRAVTNNAIEDVVGIPDWMGLGGSLSYNSSNQGVYCSGGSVIAPLDIPPGALFAGLQAFGTSSGGQTWYVLAQDIGSQLISPVVSNTSSSGFQFVNLVPANQYFVQSYIRVFVQVTPSGDANNVANGVLYFYVPGQPAFNAIRPARVYDSRLTGGRIDSGQTRRISVANSTTGAAVTPVAANAVLYNLTVTDNSGAGYLALFPAGTGWAGNSSINWISSTVANGGVVALGGDRQIDVFCSGSSTHFIVDITGYYL